MIHIKTFSIVCLVAVFFSGCSSRFLYKVLQEYSEIPTQDEACTMVRSEMQQYIATNQIIIDMTMAEVLCSWGIPLDANRHTSAEGQSYILHYLWAESVFANPKPVTVTIATTGKVDSIFN